MRSCDAPSSQHGDRLGALKVAGANEDKSMEINMKMDKGMDMESQKNEAEGKERTVEQILPLIGENGLFQKLLTIGFMAAIFAAAAQPVLSFFMTLTSTWKCVGNNGTSGNFSTQCIWNGTFPAQDERRCHLERHE